MANFLAPIGNGMSFVDSNGAPLSGAKLFTYVAGSTTKKTTHKDEAGAASHTNPIVLDSNGRPPSPIWLIGGTSYKFVLAPANDTDPPTSSIYTWDDLDGINDTSVTIDQWVDGPTPTFVSSTQFTLVGDQTTDFHVGRRLKLTVSAGTVYGRISVSAFTTLTTVTVVLDSGALDSGLSAVSLGLVTAVNQSVDVTAVKRAVQTDANNTLTGILTMSGKPIEFAEGAAVASAATTDIWTPADGNTVHITGTTTITSFGTAPQAGAFRWVIFDGALTLTHGANLNILNGGNNIITAAGDFAYVYADTTTQLDVIFFRASGQSLATNVEVFTASGTFTAKVTGQHVIILQAGGAGGSGGTSSSTGGGGGGGGAGEGRIFTQSLTAGTGYTVAIGGGGAAGGSGGNSTFDATTVLGGNNGGGGSGSSGGAGGASTTGGTGGSPSGDGTAGASTRSLLSTSGGNGGNGGATGAGGGGAGGNSMFGSGGTGGNAPGGNGSAPSARGAGGGGGAGGPTGGSGAGGESGICIVFW